jgi:hypothetical protein
MYIIGVKAWTEESWIKTPKEGMVGTWTTTLFLSPRSAMFWMSDAYLSCDRNIYTYLVPNKIISLTHDGVHKFLICHKKSKDII